MIIWAYPVWSLEEPFDPANLVRERNAVKEGKGERTGRFRKVGARGERVRVVEVLNPTLEDRGTVTLHYRHGRHRN